MMEFVAEAIGLLSAALMALASLQAFKKNSDRQSQLILNQLPSQQNQRFECVQSVGRLGQKDGEAFS
ncbi:hypothetical protein SAMN05444273_101494 [Litoreibacter ascidiaceicola]|uniref:Uncharacterized protein n=1 Tax=Litoreibacter ascidiaceicola TaxID=1486859 RepID=A0A1M4TPU5_9RHOB|nr:hypothetical protein [Litoreibacter ascidiaceicola]SHE46473.1 hypothetical protein SAMN05444273_101494 [Litoreibacter ascidiaceicola]